MGGRKNPTTSVTNALTTPTNDTIVKTAKQRRWWWKRGRTP